jgi:hypothetical protein
MQCALRNILLLPAQASAPSPSPTLGSAPSVALTQVSAPSLAPSLAPV